MMMMMMILMTTMIMMMMMNDYRSDDDVAVVVVIIVVDIVIIVVAELEALAVLRAVSHARCVLSPPPCCFPLSLAGLCGEAAPGVHPAERA